jgi:bifunctional non-homologous end joining protein LigD
MKRAGSAGRRTTPTYDDKRSFDQTPEPPPVVEGNVDLATAKPGKTFMIHQHYARRLHHDLRMEFLNAETPVLVSWAVPKGLPRRKGQRHLAVHVEDHPFEYGTFSGTIPAGNYGAGEVRIFDSGTYELLEQADAKLTFRLHGKRLQGTYHLIRTDKDQDSKDWLAFLRENHAPEPEPAPPLTPMMATLEREAFDDDRWIFEVKWDGVRALAICSDETMLMSRNGNEITAQYPELAKLHDRLVALDAIVDGEIVAMEKGRPSFERLQSRINLQNTKDIERAMKTIPVCYIAFDLIYLDGRSLIKEPVETRKELLEQIVVPTDNVLTSPVTPSDGTSLFEIASGQGLEGIVAKKLGSPYRPGKRTHDWIKVKTVYEGDLVIGGWSKGEGSRSKTFGALLVGAYAEDGLHYLGSVGTGFTDSFLDKLMPQLEAIVADGCPFVADPTGSSNRFGKILRDPRWVKPELVARVEYRELTASMRLRAPSFKGLRVDMDPKECRLEELPRP